MAEQSLQFVRLENGDYWNDLDGNGRIGDFEKFHLDPKTSKQKQADNFIATHPSYFLPFVQYRFDLTQKTVAQYFAHPEKTKFAKQLQTDLQKLEVMPDRPAIFDKLLVELKAIREELTRTVFQFSKKDYQIPDGFLATYDPQTATMTTVHNAPFALYVHEMGHAILAHQRVTETHSAFQVKDPATGKIYTIPKDPSKPAPTDTNSTYKFTLDYPQTNPKSFTYDGRDNDEMMMKLLETGEFPCLAEKFKQAALANEVQAYLTMCRYVLFKVGVTKTDLDVLGKGGTLEEKKAAVAKFKALVPAVQKELKATHLNPMWVMGILLYYFGLGGSDSKQTLDVFVDNYYTSQKAPGFADAPGCKKM